MDKKSQFNQILNFKNPFDPQIFDQIVAATKSNDSEAVIILSKYKNSHENYQHIESVLNLCKLPESHLIGLNILENLIKTKYFTFNQDTRLQFESFLFNFVKNKAESNDILLNKFNQVFVQLIIANHYIKAESSFISNLINHCQSTTINQAINLFSILRLLIEEIVVSNQPITLKNRCISNVRSDSINILNFSNLVLEKARAMDSQLIENNLVFLTVFFRLLKTYNEKNPDTYLSIDNRILQQFIQNLIGLLQTNHTTNVIKTLYQIILFLKRNETNSTNEFLSKLKIEVSNHFIIFLEMYQSKFKNSKKEFKNSYNSINDSEKEFILQSAYLLSILTDQNLQISNQLQSTIHLFASLPDLNIFKILLNSLPFNVNSFQLILNRFPRPQEVLVTELDGEIIREKITGTEAIEFSIQMRNWALKYILENSTASEIIIDCLSRVDDVINENTIDENNFIIDKKAASTNVNFTFNHKLLNSLCWTIGSVSPYLKNPDDLFVTILKHLLMLCEHKHKKEEKAIIASGIMFIVGKHYKFLKGNRKFLRTVIDKLFEFCEESYVGIKDMACDTFFMICEKLSYEDFFIHSNIHFSREKDKKNYIIVVIESFKEKTNQLLPYQQRVIIEGILLLLKHQNTSIQLLSQQIEVTDPVHFIKSQSMIVQSYLKYTKDIVSSSNTLISISDNNFVFIDQINSYILENFSNYKSDIFEYFTVYFTYIPKNEESFSKLKQFYESFKLEERVLDVLNGYVNSIQNNFDNQMNIFIKTVITSFYPTTDQITRNWLQFSNSAMNNFLLQSLQTDQQFMNTIFLGLQSNIHDYTYEAIQVLQKIYNIVSEYGNFHFTNTYGDIITENIVGMICDKDREYVFQDLCHLLKRTVKIETQVTGNNSKIIKCLIALLSQFNNLSDQYKEIVVKSITSIESEKAFYDAMNDFRMYVWAYFDYEIEDERKLLFLRMEQSD